MSAGVLMVVLVTMTVGFIYILWTATMVKTANEDTDDRADRQHKFEDVAAHAGTARGMYQAGARVSDTAIFLSISFPHLQLMSFAFLLPFGW